MKKPEWKELWEEMDKTPDEWIPTTRHMHDEMLGALPPRAMGGGGFLVGEPHSHNANDEAIYAYFTQVGDNFYARYATFKQFNDRRNRP